MDIIFSDSDLVMTTVGLKSEDGREIYAAFDDLSLSSECVEFLRCAGNYIEGGHQIRPGETMGYGYWITKLVEDGSGKLCFWERATDRNEYVPGISNTLRYWKDQKSVCERASSIFSPPNAGQLIVISGGVMEGEDVEGVRYPSPSHMSGWWITTDRYDGNTASLKTVHASHVTHERPELAQYLALGYGFRFFSDTGEVYFDPRVLDDK